MSERDRDQENLGTRFLKWLEDATDSRILAIPRFLDSYTDPLMTANHWARRGKPR